MIFGDTVTTGGGVVGSNFNIIFVSVVVGGVVEIIVEIGLIGVVVSSLYCCWFGELISSNESFIDIFAEFDLFSSLSDGLYCDCGCWCSSSSSKSLSSNESLLLSLKLYNK